MMFDDIEWDIKEYPIKGKMITGQFSVSLNQMMSIRSPDMEIKEELTRQLAQAILQYKLAEFTVQENPVDMSKMYRVRCFMTPDDHVRILRVHGTK